MSLAATEKKKIVEKFGASKSDTGATSVQIALMTERLNRLNGHFETNSKDHHSRRGLLKLVGRRRRLLNYLSDRDPAGYKKLIDELGIRR